jgi:hypothetical protein
VSGAVLAPCLNLRLRDGKNSSLIHADVGHQDELDGRLVLGLHRLLAHAPLGHEGPRPAAQRIREVQYRLADAPGTGPGSVLVLRVPVSGLDVGVALGLEGAELGDT